MNLTLFPLLMIYLIMPYLFIQEWTRWGSIITGIVFSCTDRRLIHEAPNARINTNNMLHHSTNITRATERTVRHFKSIKKRKRENYFRLLHEEITLSRHNVDRCIVWQTWRLCCSRALDIWQVVQNKRNTDATTVENKPQKYTATIRHKESTISYNIFCCKRQTQ